MPKLKALFETPGKAAVTAACILVMLATLGMAGALAANAFSRSSAIGEDAAASFAFADAGADPASAQCLRVEFGREQERFVYEVEFSSGGTQYKYLIDSEDGSVVRKEREKETRDFPQESGRPGGMTPSKTLEEAREIALADAQAAASGAVFTGEGLDQDNGLWVYEFRFQVGNARYKYEINANTGEVYSKSVETYVTPSPTPAPEAASQTAPGKAPPDDSSAGTPCVSDSGHHGGGQDPGASQESGVSQNPPLQSDPGLDTGSGCIGMDRAKAAALAHAGLTESQARITRASMGRDDGQMAYEIEFRKGQTEYAYRIDAQSGAILAHETVRD